MICYLSKWFISNALDSRKEIPGFVQHHLRRCASCQDFVRFSQVLADKSAQDALSIIRETPDSVLEKIKPGPSQAVGEKNRPGKRRWLVPAVTTALAASFIFILILFRPLQVLSPDSNQDLFQILGTSSLTRKSLQNLAVQVESPYDKEWLSLKSTIKSATNNLTSYLDLKID